MIVFLRMAAHTPKGIPMIAPISVETIARYKGMAYLRTTRPGTPLLYTHDEKFPIGGSKILKKSLKDSTLVIGIYSSLRALASRAPVQPDTKLAK